MTETKTKFDLIIESKIDHRRYSRLNDEEKANVADYNKLKTAKEFRETLGYIIDAEKGVGMFPEFHLQKQEDSNNLTWHLRITAEGKIYTVEVFVSMEMSEVENYTMRIDHLEHLIYSKERKTLVIFLLAENETTLLSFSNGMVYL